MEVDSISHSNWIFILLASLLVLVLCAPDHYIGTSRRPELPGPRGWPLFGNTFDVFFNRKRMLMYFHDLAASYGELFSLTLPVWGRSTTINHPQWLEHIKKADTVRYGKGQATLAIFAEFPGAQSPFGSEGATWRQARKAMQPVFAVKTFNTHVSLAMNVTMPRVRDLLAAANDKSLPIDWNNFSGRIALQIFCQMAMGMETDVLDSDWDCISKRHPLVDSTLHLNSISSGRLFNPLWRFTDMLDGTEKRFNSIRREFLNAIDTLVIERSSELDAGTATRNDDFLSTLLSNSGGKDPLLIRDTLVTLLFASRDNTQNSFTWALYELLNNPEWIEKMKAEAIALAPRDGGVVSFSEINAYPVHMAVFHETLRLWPGVPKNARVALTDDTLPAIPEHQLPAVKINRGDYVLWSDWSIARNTKLWGENAGKFDPGRFLSDKNLFEKPPVPKFHAFGFGPRYCPGAQLAAYEFVALFSYILLHFNFSLVEHKPRTMIDGFTITMDGPLFVNVHSLN